MTEKVPAAAVEGKGPSTVVFLHGVGGDRESWTPQLKAFSARFRAVAWDCPGYGASAPLEPMTFPGLAASLLALLDRLGAARAHIVGQSFGGMIAQEFAATFPERVRSLVLTGTSPAFGRADGDFQKRFVAERLAPLDAGKTMAELAQGIVGSLVGDDPDPAGVKAAVASMSRVAPATYRASMLCIVGFDRREALGRIAVPTLVLAGSRDTNAPAPMMEKMASKIPGARYVCLEGAGHLANLEQPAAFNEIVLKFLTEVEGG
ncbi:MAG TPA: alpha/beta fold hydrolase [Alphaproteobacteria bacterium]|nr:alpha/beta fold hydrolase [Alphaproteobacteria bacterium]